jgi:hypothetical protein
MRLFGGRDTVIGKQVMLTGSAGHGSGLLCASSRMIWLVIGDADE